MRYYGFKLGTNVEEIKENAKIELRHYGYDNVLESINSYMYQNMKNDRTFLVYREEDNLICAIFSYNEQKLSFRNAYEGILEMLQDIFGIKQVKVEPFEITMHQFMECFLECKRRRCFDYSNRIIESSNLWIYYYSCMNDTRPFPYDFKERIISEQECEICSIYHRDFVEELRNIKTHANVSEYSGNMVHYVISSRSIEAASEMTELLVQNLLKANRISSRRMEIISEIEPNIFKKNNHLEEIIENSYGGVIVLDLSEKFGYDPVDYVMASQYLEKLIKKYRNQCLFVFTYDMDHPGFAYYLLPQLKRYMMTVMLREGTGDRKAAVDYMQRLIEKSEYSKYAGQAQEFMALFLGNKFSQTDVLRAYEQFESWCLNKNVLKAYDYNLSEDFLLDREENEISAYEKLKNLIGLKIVKEQIDNIIAADIVEKERKKRNGNDYQSSAMHMIFGGNPGSAKTTVAKLFAGITKEKGILKSGAFVERGGMDLDGMGCVSAIREAFLAARGGVLFIDEAYAMKSDTAITVLLQEMENHRENVIVILAGYNERMKAFMKRNEGLKSRIPYWIDFPDYTTEELTDIFKLMIHEKGFCVTDDAIKEAHYIFEKVRNIDDFGNGRYVRNLMERAVRQQSVRLFSTSESASDIQKEELFQINEVGYTDVGRRRKEGKRIRNSQKRIRRNGGISFC